DRQIDRGLEAAMRRSDIEGGHSGVKRMNVPQKQSGGEVVMGRMDTRSLIIFLVIGVVAGFLASLVVGGGGLITYLVSGVIGSFVGGYLFSALKINLGLK